MSSASAEPKRRLGSASLRRWYVHKAEVYTLIVIDGEWAARVADLLKNKDADYQVARVRSSSSSASPIVGVGGEDANFTAFDRLPSYS